MVDRRASRGARRLRSWARRVVAPVVCALAVVALGRTGSVVDAEIINVKVTRSIVRPLLGYWRRALILPSTHVMVGCLPFRLTVRGWCQFRLLTLRHPAGRVSLTSSVARAFPAIC